MESGRKSQYAERVRGGGGKNDFKDRCPPSPLADTYTCVRPVFGNFFFFPGGADAGENFKVEKKLTVIITYSHPVIAET